MVHCRSRTQASRKGHLPLVHRLLAAAACTILVNSDGQTALELAKGEHVVQALTAHRETHAAAEAAFMAQRASAPATDSSTASAIDPRLVDAALPAQRSALAVQQAPGATHLWGVGDIVDVKVAGEWSRHAGKVQAVALVGSGQGQARYTILVRHNAHEDDALCMLLKGKEEAEMRTSSRAFLELQPTACCQIA